MHGNVTALQNSFTRCSRDSFVYIYDMFRTQKLHIKLYLAFGFLKRAKLKWKLSQIVLLLQTLGSRGCCSPPTPTSRSTSGAASFKKLYLSANWVTFGGTRPSQPLSNERSLHLNLKAAPDGSLMARRIPTCTAAQLFFSPEEKMAISNQM